MSFKFLDRLRANRAEKTQNDLERYHALVRRGAADDLNAAETKSLETLAESLAKNIEQVEADVSVVQKHNALLPVAQKWPERQQARKQHLVAIEKSRAEEIERRRDHDRSHDQMIGDLSHLDFAMLESSKAQAELDAIASRHAVLLAIAPPTPPALSPRAIPQKSWVEKISAPPKPTISPEVLAMRDAARNGPSQSWVERSGGSKVTAPTSTSPPVDPAVAAFENEVREKARIKAGIV